MLEKIRFLKYKILTLPNFVDLRLPKNNLSYIPHVIYSIKKLSILILNDNLITDVSEGIGNLKELTQLHLQNNSIRSLSKEIGQLSNLTHLYLDNNPIDYLPSSIKELKKLSLLSINGSKLPIPPNYSPNTPQNTINYILENQVSTDEPFISFTNAYFFKNIQKPIIQSKFDEILESYSKEIEVEFRNIESLSQINNSINIIFFLITFDSHTDLNISNTIWNSNMG